MVLRAQPSEGGSGYLILLQHEGIRSQSAAVQVGASHVACRRDNLEVIWLCVCGKVSLFPGIVERYRHVLFICMYECAHSAGFFGI